MKECSKCQKVPQMFILWWWMCTECCNSFCFGSHDSGACKNGGDTTCLVIRVFCFSDFVCVTGASRVSVISSCFSILVWNVYSCCMLLRNHFFCSFTFSACVILVFLKDYQIDFASDYWFSLKVIRLILLLITVVALSYFIYLFVCFYF